MPASSTSRTWASSRSKGRGRPSFLQRVLSNDVSKLEEGDAQYTLLTNESGGIIDDLIVYRTASHRYLLVVNAANREADFAWLDGPRGPRLGRSRRLRRVRAARGAGPRALERLGLERRPAVHVGDGRARRDRGDDQPHRLHRRGGRRARLHGRRRAGALGRDPRARRQAVRSRRARHAAARGLLPAARQRHRARNGTRSRAASAGSARSTPSSSAPSALREIKARGPGAEARRLPDDRAGDPAPGDGDRRAAARSPRARSRRCSTSASVSATSPRQRAQPGTELTVDVRGRQRDAARWSTKPIYKREE